MADSSTSLFELAVDGLVTINSQLMVAAFIGVAVSAPGQHSIVDPSHCDPGADMSVHLLTYEIVAFSFFMLSTMMALSLKIAMFYVKSRLPEGDDRSVDQISPFSAKVGLLISSTACVIGGIFILLSLAAVVQIRLGVLSCHRSTAAVSTVAIVGGSSIFGFIGTIVYALLLKIP